MKRQSVEDKKIVRILLKAQERCGPIQGIQRILESLVQAEDWDKVLLALCNICIGKSGKGMRIWYRRAQYLHRVMEKEKTRREAKEALEAVGELA